MLLKRVTKPIGVYLGDEDDEPTDEACTERDGHGEWRPSWEGWIYVPGQRCRLR